VVLFRRRNWDCFDVLISDLRSGREEGKEEGLHLRDRGNFHRCADDDDQIDYGGVVLCESVEEAAGKLLAEESNIGLHISVLKHLQESGLVSPSSHQVAEHHSVRRLQSRSDSTSILTCH
jgi:hypothetical protein